MAISFDVKDEFNDQMREVLSKDNHVPESLRTLDVKDVLFVIAKHLKV